MKVNNLNPEIITVVGIILIAIGTYFVYYGRKITNTVLQTSLHNQSQQLDNNSVILKDQSAKITSQDSTIKNLEENNLKLIEQSSELLQLNKGIQRDNQSLYVQNKTLTDKIDQYQTELEQKSQEIEQLKSAEESRKRKEVEKNLLKNTQPDLVVFPSLTKNGELSINFDFRNKVPVKSRYAITRADNDRVIGPIMMGYINHNPSKKKMKFSKLHGNINEFKIPTDKVFKIRLTATVFSIYQSEINDKPLTLEFENIYEINPMSMTIKFIE